jgi:NAD-dependent dihydropyrimidine dehydrogenase PreA subunit
MKSHKTWPKPSTIAFIQEARRTPGYSLLDWVHGYVYARWPYLYIGIGTGEHPLARFFGPVVRWLARWLTPKSAGKGPDQITFADTYHGKVVPLEAATQLVTVDEEITLTDLEKVIPYALARDIVLKNPDHIVALDCPCRASRPNPCLPLDVCLAIGEPFASLVAEHHPRRSRWITPEEAVEILRAEDERGHVHHAFFKDAMLGRFYAICNCCACCCGAMQAHQHGTPMLASSGYVSRVDADLCTGCGTCTESCQFGALALDDGLVTIDPIACMGCGVCVSKCAQGALSLVRDPDRGEPLEINELQTRSAPATANA